MNPSRLCTDSWGKEQSPSVSYFLLFCVRIHSSGALCLPQTSVSLHQKVPAFSVPWESCILLLFLTLMCAVLCLFLNGEKHDKNVHIFLAQGGLMPYDIYFPILFLITSCRLCLHYTSLMTCCRCVVYCTFIFLHKSFEGVLRVRKVCDWDPCRSLAHRYWDEYVCPCMDSVSIFCVLYALK